MEKNRPVYEQRIGNVRVAIWQNVSEGKTADGPKSLWHNVTIGRRFKANDGNWKETNTFNGLGDLSQVGTAVWLAQEWLKNHQDGPHAQEEATE